MEYTLVIVNRQPGKTVCHRQYVPFIEDEKGASSEREKTQEGMTSSATHNDGDKKSEDKDYLDVIKFQVFNIVLDRVKLA